MKTILLKLLLFIVIIVTLITVMVLLSDYLINERKDKVLNLSTDLNLVFAGNSTVECAVEDRLIDHSINVAQAGEAYLYSFAKIKALLDQNDHIKTVFIGYSYADLLFEKEETWLLNDYFMVEKVQYYRYVLDNQEKVFLLKSNPIAYLKGVIKSVVKSFETVAKSFSADVNRNSIPNFGGYKRLDRDKLNEDPAIDTGRDEIVKPSTNQLRYHRMISELCHQRSVDLVMFNPPKHNSYYENLDPEIKQLWLDVRHSLSADLLLDMAAFPMPDSCYGDLSHLNYRGARIFSEYLNEIIGAR